MTDDDIVKIEKQIDEEMVTNIEQQAKQAKQQQLMPQQPESDGSGEDQGSETPTQYPQEPQLSQ